MTIRQQTFPIATRKTTHRNHRNLPTCQHKLITHSPGNDSKSLLLHRFFVDRLAAWNPEGLLPSIPRIPTVPPVEASVGELPGPRVVQQNSSKMGTPCCLRVSCYLRCKALGSQQKIVRASCLGHWGTR